MGFQQGDYYDTELWGVEAIQPGELCLHLPSTCHQAATLFPKLQWGLSLKLQRLKKGTLRSCTHSSDATCTLYFLFAATPNHRSPTSQSKQLVSMWTRELVSD